MQLNDVNLKSVLRDKNSDVTHCHVVCGYITLGRMCLVWRLDLYLEVWYVLCIHFYGVLKGVISVMIGWGYKWAGHRYVCYFYPCMNSLMSFLKSLQV